MDDQALAVTGHVSLVVIMLGAGYVRAFEAVRATYGVDASAIYGFTSSEQIASILVVVMLSMLIVLLKILLVQVVKEKRLPMMRLVSTGQPPKLELKLGQRFHLFLSHTWASAQE
eukprot:4898688-Prymnesium_polylepis.1